MAGNCYKKNFINKVIAKLDFASPTNMFTPESVADAVIEIKKRFPISEQSTASQHGLQISKEGVKSSKIEFPEWIFHGENRNKMLKVNQLFIEILLTKYFSEDDFKNDLIIPISHLLKINPQTAIRRTGIRFINIFDFPIDTFSKAQEYFSDSITSQYFHLTDTDKCSRSFLINEFVIDDVKLRVQSGFFNPDYPAIIKRNHFVLDFDAYIDYPHLINDAESYFKKIHDLIEVKFEALITDKLRKEVLNGE
jgi:uncharacterized protein (TIGR04255 family)